MLRSPFWSESLMNFLYSPRLCTIVLVCFMYDKACFKQRKGLVLFRSTPILMGSGLFLDFNVQLYKTSYAQRSAQLVHLSRPVVHLVDTIALPTSVLLALSSIAERLYQCEPVLFSQTLIRTISTANLKQ